MKTEIASKILVAIALLGLSQTVNANHQKRSRRYPSYEHNSLDVLSGINEGEYDQIYIHYHGCVWSEYSGDNCGGEGGGDGNDAEWYLGKTQCYRANVAYSLYGIRVDDKKKRKDNVCRRRYFINTFFTSNGMEDFSDAVGLANGGDATSECTVQDNGNGNEYGNENNNNGGRANNARMNTNAQSYTTYCNRDGKFVTAQFGGAYCTDKSNLQLLDSLDTLNNELENIGCLFVYSNDGNNKANDAGAEEGEEQGEEAAENQDQGDEENVNDDEGRRLEDANNQHNGGDDGLWNLLASSSVCSTIEYPRGCPDPHGAKKKFDVNARSSNSFWKQFMWLDWLTLVFFFVSIVLLVLAFCVYKDRRKRSKSKSASSSNQKTRQSSRFGRSTSSKTKNTSQKSEKESTSTTEVNRTTSASTQKSKKGLFLGMFRKNNNTTTSSS